MANILQLVVVGILIGIMYVGLPLTAIVGWIRFFVRSDEAGAAKLSVAAHTVASASLLLFWSTLIYARTIGGFRYYDPVLMRIYGWGAILSLIAVVLALLGAVRHNRLKWYALGCAIGSLVIWLVSAMGE